MQHSSTVLISGASYAGLTLAKLLRSRGIDCSAQLNLNSEFEYLYVYHVRSCCDAVVLEARAQLLHQRDRGVGLWTHAQTILRQPDLGIAERVRCNCAQDS